MPILQALLGERAEGGQSFDWLAALILNDIQHPRSLLTIDRCIDKGEAIEVAVVLDEPLERVRLGLDQHSCPPALANMCLKPIVRNAVECPHLDEEEGSRVVTTTQIVRDDVVEVDLDGKPGLGRERRDASNPIAKTFESSLE
jgi:hypothetical protein